MKKNKFHLNVGLISLLLIIIFFISCGKSNDKGKSQKFRLNKMRMLLCENKGTNKIGENIFSNRFANENLINNQVLNFEDTVLLFQLFKTNWWDSDLTVLSNYLKKASFETCNKLCNITGEREDYYGEQLVALFGLQKADSLYQSNNMLVRIAQSSYLMRDLHLYQGKPEKAKTNWTIISN